jgi:hypothetical protein
MREEFHDGNVYNMVVNHRGKVSSRRCSVVSEGDFAAAHDVLRIGHCEAGQRSAIAIAIAEANPRLDVAVISNVYRYAVKVCPPRAARPGSSLKATRSRSRSTTPFRAVTGWRIGTAVEVFGEEAPRELLQLEHWVAPESTARRPHVADRAIVHVLGCKGLERRAVVLCVNERKVRERSRERLYVGMSRATDELVVVGDPEVIREMGGDAVAKQLGI